MAKDFFLSMTPSVSPALSSRAGQCFTSEARCGSAAGSADESPSFIAEVLELNESIYIIYILHAINSWTSDFSHMN